MVINVIPYAASFKWYAAWMNSISDGSDQVSAVVAANISTSSRGKDFARTMIAGNHGNLMLSMAVEGGAGRLRRDCLVATASLSGHGNWRKNHAGALEATYGKMPYFQHIYPYILNVLSGSAVSLPDFNSGLHKTIISILGIDEYVSPGRKEWDSMRDAVSPQALERGEEILDIINPSLSIIDALMRHGPETLLALYAYIFTD